MQLKIDLEKIDLIKIEKILLKNDLSTYKLDERDFICYKEKVEIIAFWRIYKIDEINFELSSIWVKEAFRWKKLWTKVIIELLKYKYKKDNLFLATKSDLEEYYKKTWFRKIKIDSSIPKRFLATLEWAKKENIDAIVMKYNK